MERSVIRDRRKKLKGGSPISLPLYPDYAYPQPMKVEDIEEAILKLSPEDLAKFRRWFAEFQTGMAPPKIPEATAVKLGRLAGRTFAEIRKRAREP
jgi:hypothetical protein